MKISFFWQKYVVWVNYSNRLDCDLVLNITKEDFEKVKKWTHTIERNKGSYKLIEKNIEWNNLN